MAQTVMYSSPPWHRMPRIAVADKAMLVMEAAFLEAGNEGGRGVYEDSAGFNRTPNDGAAVSTSRRYPADDGSSGF